MKEQIILIMIIMILIITILIFKKKSKNKKDEQYPFYAKKPLSNPEQILYHRLTEALPDYIILAQVQLSRILGVKKGYNFNEWNNKINRMSIDFIVCLKDSTIITAIELDDKSHEKTERIKADEKKNKALSDAGIKLIRWNTKKIPNIETIKTEIKN